MSIQNFFKPLIMSTALLATACGNTQDADENIIDKPDFTPSGTTFSIDALEALGRVNAPVVSPDNKKILYSVSYENVEKNASNADLYVMNADGSEQTRITRTPKSESNAVWIDKGKRIAFLYPDAEGKQQIWIMNADGSERKQISHNEKGIDGFLFSHDKKKILMISQVQYSRKASEVYPDLPKASGRIIDDLMYKHWDEWVTTIPHPFVGAFNGEKITNVSDIMANEPFEAPMKPFGGIESFAWGPDSRYLIYVSRKKQGVDYALSTNSDLYIYDTAENSTECLTEGMMGYDTNPIFSPDGTKLAWLSMERDGYESDKNRIIVMDFETRERTDITTEWDYTIDAMAWNPNSRSIYFIAPYQGTQPIFSIDIESRAVTTVAEGTCDYASLSPLGPDAVVALRHSLLYPNEVVLIKGGQVTQLTNVNTELLSALHMPTVERRMVPTTDGKEMLTWIVKPQDFDPNRQYPAILYCQGGPQQPVSQFWSYRWNLALMAANGYVVIAPNRRGLPGFGTEWNAQISGDYPGQNMKDYLQAVDNVKTEPWIDAAHIGAVGASYGGFSVYWLAGNHNNRFACLIAHAGIFNMEAQYLETEEMWFANWDMGGGAWNAPADATTAPDYGAFWNKSNATAQRTFANSPHKFVDKWTAPILITHGEYDYRILSSQGEMAFNAAKLRGIPAEMLIFPDENHWILKPQNAVLWQRVFFRWLDRWLQPEAAATDTNV